MKVVEVIRGLKTDPLIIDALNDLSRAFGHRPVVAKDTLDLLLITRAELWHRSAQNLK